MTAEIFTTVTINERTFAIKKFDAKAGLKMARFVIAKLAPLIPMLNTGIDEKGEEKEMSDEQLYEVVGMITDKLSDDDIDSLVDKCLRVCYEVLPAGRAAVIDETGHYGVEGVEYNPVLALRLCFEAIKWGASAFFDGKNLPLKFGKKEAGSQQSQ